MIMINDCNGHSLLMAVLVEETCIYAGRGCEMTLVTVFTYRWREGGSVPTLVASSFA